MSRIGIFGGTFNPVHNGHLALVRAAQKKFSIEKIIFVPASYPPHKIPLNLASASDRLAMLELVCEKEDSWEVSRIELDRGGTSFTIDTVGQLRQNLENSDELLILIGGDNLAEISSWRRIQDLLEFCRFVAVTRPGYLLEEDNSWIKRVIGPERQNLIEMNIPVSSTMVREQIKKGKSLTGLVPPSVEEYIKIRGLY